MQPGEGLERRAGHHRHQAEQLGRDPDRGRGRLVAAVRADLLERRPRALQHRRGPGTAQQRLPGLGGRGLAQPPVAQQRVHAVARRGVRRGHALQGGQAAQRVGAGDSAHGTEGWHARMAEEPRPPRGSLGPMDTPRAPQDRPAFPEDAVVWLAGPTPRTVVVLGSGEIAAALEAAGHEVTCPPGRPDRLPQPDRSVDLVISARSLPRDLQDVARVLRPGGQLALVCHDRDQRIPWARKLDRTLGTEVAGRRPHRRPGHLRPVRLRQRAVVEVVGDRQHGLAREDGPHRARRPRPGRPGAAGWPTRWRCTPTTAAAPTACRCRG